jgi:hypothetical protein
MTVDEVEAEDAAKDLNHFLINEADLDTLAKLYSLYVSDNPVQVVDHCSNGKSEVFENGKEIPDKTAKD